MLQHGALRCDMVVCCGKHVLLQQTTEEESAVVAEQKERQVTTGYSMGTLRSSWLVLPPTRVPWLTCTALVSGNRPSVLLAPDAHDYP